MLYVRALSLVPARVLTSSRYDSIAPADLSVLTGRWPPYNPSLPILTLPVFAPVCTPGAPFPLPDRRPFYHDTPAGS